MSAAPSPSRFRVLSMPGEGIGPEIVREGERVLRAIAEAHGIDVVIEPCEVGEPALAKYGKALPDDVIRRCNELERGGGAILFGAVSAEPLGTLRWRYDLFANLRPARASAILRGISPLRPERIQDLDVMVVRELVSGIYFGETREGTGPKGAWASQELYYDESQVRRIAERAFALANARRRRLCWVHKANVVKGVFGLWGRVVSEVAARWPNVAVEDCLVDNMAMQLVLRPAAFDVVLAENMFGDILSDLLAGVVGSIGVLPSASLNDAGFGLYESIGGTAPDLAGRDVANPISTILSVAMMCEHTFGLPDAARRIERAVEAVLGTMRTQDLRDDALPVVSTRTMGEAIADAVRRG